jgi:hypothetical protein
MAMPVADVRAVLHGTKVGKSIAGRAAVARSWRCSAPTAATMVKRRRVRPARLEEVGAHTARP